MCYAKVVDGLIYKGCQTQDKCDFNCERPLLASDEYDDASQSDPSCGYCCHGYKCNRPPSVPEPPKCDVARAMECSTQVVTTVLKSATITERCVFVLYHLCHVWRL